MDQDSSNPHTNVDNVLLSLAEEGKSDNFQLPPQVVIETNDQDNASPESGSLYSDEIPSGYNSGEQYDTLSTGYMSGEAYELPETRMDLHEPALDVIEECLQPLDSINHHANDDSDTANIFVLPGSGGIGGIMDKDKDKDKMSLSSSSTETSDQMDSATFRNVAIEGSASGQHDLSTRSPNYGSIKSKLRKKVTTFAIPIENTPLKDTNEDFGFDPESSDAGAATGGYRAVPSDTDTSAFDSDVAVAAGDKSGSSSANPTDSGTELLNRPKTKAERIAARKAKRIRRRHDEDWFNANDNKYWATTRLICFWLSIAAMIGTAVAAAVLIYLMPRNCDPELEWFQGTVLMDVRPRKVNGSDDFNINLQELTGQLPSLEKLGVRGIVLKDLAVNHDLATGKKRFLPTSKYNDYYKQIFNVAGDSQLESSLRDFISKVHDQNLTIMIEIPLVEDQEHSKDVELSFALEQHVTNCIQFWSTIGVDGISITGLENFAVNYYTPNRIRRWSDIFEEHATTPNQRLLMTSYLFAERMQSIPNLVDEALSHFGLLDANLDLNSLDRENVTDLALTLESITKWDVAIKNRPWINWNLNPGRLPLSNAGLALQFFLPGTVTVRQQPTESPSLQNLTQLRTVAVPIHMNGNYRRCQCEDGTHEKIESNMAIKEYDAIVQMERFYNRRNRYILVANFDPSEKTNLDMVANMYSSGEVILDTSGRNEVNKEVKISELELDPSHALVIKLPK